MPGTRRYARYRSTRPTNTRYGLRTKLTQIHLGLSNLRGQLFNYFLCDNPFCPLCFDAFESLDHFFLYCTILNIERDVFMNRLKLLIPNVIQYNKRKLILTSVTVVGHDSDMRILKESIEFIKKNHPDSLIGFLWIIVIFYLNICCLRVLIFFLLDCK